LPCERRAARHGLQQALDRRDDDFWRVLLVLRSDKPFEQLNALPEDVVGGLAIQRFGGGKKRRHKRREQSQVVDQFIGLFDSGTDDDQGGWGMRGQCGGGQRARRPPDSVESRRLARAQTRNDLGEAVLSLQTPGQFEQPAARVGGRLGVRHHSFAIIAC